MRNIRKIVIGILVIVGISYASLTEGRQNDEQQVRVPRSTKESSKTGDKQNKKQTAAVRAQLNYGNQQELTTNGGATNAEFMTNVNGDASNGLLSPNGQQMPGGFNVRLLGLPPNAGANPLNNPFIGQPLLNYARNFPYPGMPYPPTPMQPNLPGPPQSYFYGNPNGDNFIGQGPLPGAPNSQLPFPGPYTNSFMAYGNFQGEQQGFPANTLMEQQFAAQNLQTPTFAQRPPDFMNPFGGGFPYMARQHNPSASNFVMPAGYFSGYPRLQRALKLKKEE